MSGTTRCHRELTTAFVVIVLILVVAHALPRSTAVRRNRHASVPATGSHGVPPDTAGFFFGKRIAVARGAGMGMHPNANNLMFGKRSPSRLAAVVDDLSSPLLPSADQSAQFEGDQLSVGDEGDVCRSLRVVCASKWSIGSSPDENESISY